MPNIICMKWGTAYGPEYVNRLYAMVRRNLSGDFRFVCFTDDANGIREEVETQPLPELSIPAKNAVSPWRKLTTFKPELGGLEGQTLFLDLDLVITDSIDPLFDYEPEKFCIIENFTQKGRGIGNSSVYRFEIGKHSYILDEYHANYDSLFDDYDNSQTFVSRMIAKHTNGDEPVFWPETWCRSFKVDCLPKGMKRWIQTPVMPEGAKIVAFHGRPNPPDAIAGRWPGRFTKHVRPTPWVADYWRE